MYRYFSTTDYSNAAVVATLLTIFTFIVSISLFRELLNLPRRKRRPHKASVQKSASLEAISAEIRVPATDGPP
jgi:hypothetical protein